MNFFYLSSFPNAQGDHLIHDKNCPDLPDPLDRDYIGPFNNGREAMRKAIVNQERSVCCEKCCNSSFEATFSELKPRE